MATATITTNTRFGKLQKVTTWIMYVTATAPFLFIASLLAYYFKAANALGYNPSYNHPDPKELPFYSQYEYWIVMTFNGWAFSVLAWPVLVALIIISAWGKINWIPIIITLHLHLIGFVLFLGFSDIIEWFGD